MIKGTRGTAAAKSGHAAREPAAPPRMEPIEDWALREPKAASMYMHLADYVADEKLLMDMEFIEGDGRKAGAEHAGIVRDKIRSVLRRRGIPSAACGLA